MANKKVKRNAISPFIGFRYYEGEEDDLKSFEILSLGSPKSELVKRAVKGYIESEKAKAEERARNREKQKQEG